MGLPACPLSPPPCSQHHPQHIWEGWGITDGSWVGKPKVGLSFFFLFPQEKGCSQQWENHNHMADYEDSRMSLFFTGERQKIPHPLENLRASFTLPPQVPCETDMVPFYRWPKYPSGHTAHHWRCACVFLPRANLCHHTSHRLPSRLLTEAQEHG